MRASWKKTLYDYVRHQNQLEIEGNVDRLAAFVRDESIVRKESILLQRLVQRDLFRNVERLKNELYFKLLHVTEKSQSVVVHFQVRRKLHYKQRSRMFCEQRYETNICELTNDSGRWYVTHVKAVRDEQKDQDISMQNTLTKLGSTPYLHPLVIAQQRGDRAVNYDRLAVKSYADQWWNDYNPAYESFSVDCTNFVSQCLYAGGIPMDYTNSKEKGWWYREKKSGSEWSLSWSVAHSLHWYLMNPNCVFRAKRLSEPQHLQIGDVILYDWDGTGRYGHSVIVAEKDENGMPLVNAHTSNSKHRYWDYRDSYAWSERTQYRFFHIAQQS